MKMSAALAHQLSSVYKQIFSLKTVFSPVVCNPLKESRREYVRISSCFLHDSVTRDKFGRDGGGRHVCHHRNILICDTKHNLSFKFNGVSSSILVSHYGTQQHTVSNTGASEPVQLTLPQKFVESLPKRYQPYMKLSRVDRPIGTWLLFWPATWGLAAASGGIPDLTLLALFGVGAFVMRGAGCTVNDMWDRHIDPKVKRTSERPLASGQLRLRHATAWLAGQLSIAFGILLQLNPSCFLISCGALGLVCLYPLAKRVTYWPQAVLGLTFNTGVLIGFAASKSTETGLFSVPYLDPTCLSLYTAGIMWTLIYDTIYAHQDLQDDTLLGLGSTARIFGENTKQWLSGFSCLMVSSLAMAGVTANMTWPFYLGLGGVSAHLIWQIATLNIKDAANCAERFTANRHIGWLILISMLASFWAKEMQNQKSHSGKPQVEIKSLPVAKYAASLDKSL